MSIENSSFYDACQMDIIDYGYFSDVFSLDSTYCTNSSHRPLAVFFSIYSPLISCDLWGYIIV